MLKLTAILKNRLIRSNKKLVKIVRCHVQVTHVKFLSVSCSKTFDICNASIRAYHVSIFLNLELIFMCINFVSVFSVLSVVNQVVSFFYTQPSLVKIKKSSPQRDRFKIFIPNLFVFFFQTMLSLSRCQ